MIEKLKIKDLKMRTFKLMRNLIRMRAFFPASSKEIRIKRIELSFYYWKDKVFSSYFNSLITIVILLVKTPSESKSLGKYYVLRN